MIKLNQRKCFTALIGATVLAGSLYVGNKLKNGVANPVSSKKITVSDTKPSVLLEQFAKLSAQKQQEALHCIFERSDQETGTGVLYEHIVKMVNPKFISVEELILLAKTDATARGSYEHLLSDPGRVTVYMGTLDMVVVPAENYAVELNDVFRNRMTINGIRAHESLHKIQRDYSLDERISSALVREGYIKQGQEIDFSNLELPATVVPLVRTIANKPDAPESEVSAMIGASLAYGYERSVLQEIAARMLTPNVHLNGEHANVSLDENLSKQFKKDHAFEAVNLIARLYGVCLNEAETDIDIRVNRLVGEKGRSFKLLTQYLDGLPQKTANEQIRIGYVFLECRSAKLDQVPNIAREVLTQYGIK